MLQLRHDHLCIGVRVSYTCCSVVCAYVFHSIEFEQFVFVLRALYSRFALVLSVLSAVIAKHDILFRSRSPTSPATL